MLGFSEFSASLHSFVIKNTLMNKLGTACLYSEIILSKCNLRLSGVAILRNKITSIASKHNVIYLTFSARADHNHFADVSKMVCG